MGLYGRARAFNHRPGYPAQINLNTGLLEAAL